ncbi:MAG: nucleotide pyrophosphohydrolase [Thomasclavelia sp.]|uniref:nucleotide pyrophosphohydrolase n=1 Tax=Thomasclavelia sp. TaxID=3025757 RepID=UPI0039A01D60
MKEIENKIIEFVQARKWDQLEHPDSLIKSIAIEAGELLECIQWNNEYDRDKISEELADVMIYCFQLAYSLNLDTDKIITEKLIKNTKKYPVKN